MSINYEGRTARMLEVGPKLAQTWLNSVNTRNRNLIERAIAKYAKSMKEGRWRALVGEPISFAEDGTLLNGQQRLNAVVRSGTTQRFLVLEGLPLEDQDVMDAGAVRKTGQQFTLKGWKNGGTVASVVRLLLQWHTQTLLAGTYTPDTDECIQFAERYRPRVETAVGTAQRVRRSVTILPAVVGSVAFTAFDIAAADPDRLDVDTIGAFFTALESGADLSAKSPILTMRNHATRQRAQGMKVEPANELYYLIRTWNAWRADEEMERLQLPRGGPVTYNHLIMK